MKYLWQSQMMMRPLKAHALVIAQVWGLLNGEEVKVN